MSEFNPQRIPTANYPFPPGTAVVGPLGAMYTVVDRDGYVFLACCPWCEEHAIASGFYPQHDNGRMLHQTTAAVPEWQARCRTCVRDDYDVSPCALPSGHDGDCTPAMAIEEMS